MAKNASSDRLGAPRSRSSAQRRSRVSVSRTLIRTKHSIDTDGTESVLAKLRETNHRLERIRKKDEKGSQSETKKQGMIATGQTGDRGGAQSGRCGLKVE